MTTASLPALDELARRLREGALRSLDLVEAAFAGRGASKDTVGPYKTWDPTLARRQADAADAAFLAGVDAGALQGIPISVKDLFGVAGWPTFGGTSSRLPAAWEQQGPVVDAVRSQLCVVMGKTHTVELAFGGLGTNPHWGTPRNPWDSKAHRVPGGSSAGAGVSLVEGSALLAFGTDTAGSVRIPASMTGTVGLKTSYGRWPTEGIVPLSSSLDSVGVLARTVRDVVFAFDAIEQGLFGRAATPVRPRALPGCRIGLPERFFWENTSPGIDGAVKSAIDALERGGAVIVPLELAATEEAYELFLQGGLAGAEVAAFLQEALPGVSEQLDPAVRDRIRAAESMLATEYIHRCGRFAALGRAAAATLADVDAMVTPTVAISPPTVAELSELETYRRCNILALRNTSMANLLSLCAVSLPVGMDALGLPVGMQLLAPLGGDAALLSLAMAVEAELSDR